jgi:hypothetical protein
VRFTAVDVTIGINSVHNGLEEVVCHGLLTVEVEISLDDLENAL